MSWLKGIAGRAEDFLNRMDQTAAQALQKTPNSSVVDADHLLLSEHVQSWSPSDISGSNSVSQTGTYHSVNSPVYSSSSKTSQSTPPKNQNQRKKKDDDEKLLEFLNSDETITPSPKKLLPRKSYQTSSSPQQINVQESLSTSLDISSSGEISETTPSMEDVKTIDCSLEKTVSEVTEEPSKIESHQLIETATNSEDNSLYINEDQDAHNQQTATSSVTQNSLNSDSEHSRQIQLENENSLLRKEITSLNQEISAVVKKAKNNETEMNRMQKKLDHWTSQISGSDHLIRELQARETDLTAALSAKDSQLAVLRVRLQEADQEVEVKRKLVDELRVENERILRDHNDSSGLHNQALESMREKLQEVEMLLKREQDSYRSAQTEYMQRLSKLEEEQQNLAESLTSAQKQLVEEKSKTRDLTAQLKLTKGNLDAVRQELADYKQKAQRILQSKEKLIVSLKDSGRIRMGEDDQEGLAASSEIAVELEELKQERDSIKEELQRANITIDTLHNDMQEMEHFNNSEADAAQEQQRSLEDQLRQEKQYKIDLEQECIQQKEEIKFLHEDHIRTKTNLEARIQDRDTEIDKLRKQITAKNMSTTTQAELEARLCALTENLIQKQTIVEALSTEKNSLVLQLERMEQQMKELQLYGARKQTAVVGMSNVDIDGKIKSFTESPYDGSVTRRMKRMYGTIDAFSIRLGVFLRRYPVARVFIIVYMLLLHLWVMVVLLTYQPEVHGSHYDSKGTKL